MGDVNLTASSFASFLAEVSLGFSSSWSSIATKQPWLVCGVRQVLLILPGKSLLSVSFTFSQVLSELMVMVVPIYITHFCFH